MHTGAFILRRVNLCLVQPQPIPDCPMKANIRFDHIKPIETMHLFYWHPCPIIEDALGFILYLVGFIILV